MNVVLVSGFSTNEMILFTIGAPLTGTPLPKSITKILVMDIITRITRTLVVHKIATYFIHVK
jgi:hypothetical protein